MPLPPTQQLPLSELDKRKLIKLCDDRYAQYSADLKPRMAAMSRWYKLWRNGMDMNGFPEEERSNFSIPLIPWTIKAKVAKELDVLLGEESEIVVNPVGQSDVARADKVQKWLNWRVKTSLKLFKKLYVHLLQKYIFGVSIAFVPWVTRTRTVKRPQVQLQMQEMTDSSGLSMMVPVPAMVMVDEEVVDFDGPEVIIENLEDWFFDVTTSDILSGDFCRRLWITIDDLLDLRDEGKLDAAYVAEKLEDLRRLAESSTSTPIDDVTDEKATQSGTPAQPTTPTGKFILQNWFVKFRLNTLEDGSGGDERATPLVAFYQPERKCLLGVCRLVDIFPDGRSHFIVSQATLDVNSPYPIGQAELLEPISQEMDAFHRLAVSAAEGSIGPVVFYNPSSGFDPEKFKLEPMSAYACADPNGIKVVNLGQIQLAPYITLMQEMQAFAEKLTSLTDAQLGRTSEAPNAPRTFGQQQLLQAESNVNLLLDVRVEREALRELLNLIWEMDKRFLPKPYFFRVTESDPGDVMTDEDMMGNYDFDIGPVTAISNRAQKTQELMQAFALVQPLMIPQLTIGLAKKVLKRLGQDDVAAMLPDLAKLLPPLPPDQENVRMIQGESLDPNPLDNPMEHIPVHSAALQQLQQEVAPGISLAASNPGAGQRIQLHIEKHLQLAQQQAMMMQMVQGQQAAQQPSKPGAKDGKAQQVNGQARQSAPNEMSQNGTSSLMNSGNMNLA